MLVTVCRYSAPPARCKSPVFEHGLVNDLVLGHVEVDALDETGHIGNRVFREQHAAERALLCKQIVGRRPLVPAAVLFKERVRDSQVCN